jgi:hypothetical protein
MKNILTILAAVIFAIFFSSQVSASGYLGKTKSGGGAGYMAEAIEHAEEAKTHKAHVDHIIEHAKMSLEYVKKAEIEAIEHGNNKGRVHITESIQHLVEAIRHAKMGHAAIATEHIADALEEMHQFIIK